MEIVWTMVEMMARLHSRLYLEHYLYCNSEKCDTFYVYIYQYHCTMCMQSHPLDHGNEDESHADLRPAVPIAGGNNRQTLMNLLSLIICPISAGAQSLLLQQPWSKMYEIRTLSADDWEAWSVLRLAALANAPDAFGSTFNNWVNAAEARWRGRLSIPGAIDLAAYEVTESGGEERAVGMATGIPAGDGMAEMISMWVDPGFRGRGLASTLIGRIARWAEESGFSELRLAVRPDNATAQSVYRCNGFVVSDEPGDELPDGRREIIMLRSLGNSPA